MKNISMIHINGKAFIYGGIFYTTIVILWPIFMVLAELEGDIQGQLLTIADNPSIYRWNFAIASMIAPAISFLIILLAFGISVQKRTPILHLVGVIFLVPYVILVSISYISQYTILFKYLSIGNMELASQWYFQNVDSMAYFLNQLGYSFFAVSALLIGYKFLYEKGLPRAIGILLSMSGSLSIVAFIGYIGKNDWLTGSTIVSGILTVPIGILVIILGFRIQRKGMV
ncbi:DUF4386 family protein [Evansella sp. AB-P1]|uniref:DUF4386 family protein n=1 Tax=Evansella sp. AB-P1 TaxID=3037653 RepID=UPI00241C55B0|nr:DUF4386 family protein [Evansella sp. AB-P1]MDG5788838.1 DUF4386 family protein [Evansella sp. AB-P1]